MNASSDSLGAASFTITELANEFEVTTRAIRFYEDQGLLAPRREGRRRVYSRRDRTRLKLILRGKRLGFSLADTRELFDLYDTARGEDEQVRHFLAIIRERREMLEQQRRDIDAVLQEMATVETECRSWLKAGKRAKA